MAEQNSSAYLNGEIDVPLKTQPELLTTQAELEANFDPEPPAERGEPTSYVTCYNSSCDDYRVRRDAAGPPCQCKKSREPVKGAGRSPGWY